MTDTTDVHELATNALTERELDEVRGGENNNNVCSGGEGLNRALATWNHLLGQYHLPTTM
jgi:hypothetical protein